jgi:hypothetical protein
MSQRRERFWTTAYGLWRSTKFGMEKSNPDLILMCVAFDYELGIACNVCNRILHNALQTGNAPLRNHLGVIAADEAEKLYHDQLKVWRKNHGET